MQTIKNAATTHVHVDPYAAARRAWERRATGLPFETCRLPDEERPAHFARWEIAWWREPAPERGPFAWREPGAYRCLACFPELRDRAFGAGVGAAMGASTTRVRAAARRK